MTTLQHDPCEGITVNKFMGDYWQGFLYCISEEARREFERRGPAFTEVLSPLLEDVLNDLLGMYGNISSLLEARVGQGQTKMLCYLTLELEFFRRLCGTKPEEWHSPNSRSCEMFAAAKTIKESFEHWLWPELGDPTLAELRNALSVLNELLSIMRGC